MPVVVFPPPWEDGCGAADPNLSNVTINSSTTNGRVPKAVGEVGTINAGANTPVPAATPPAQVRMYLGADGNLYALDNTTGKAFMISATATVPQPPIYSPTK